MLYAFLMFMFFIGNDIPQGSYEIKLEFSSEEFYFRGGGIFMFRSHASTDEVKPSNGTQYLNRISLANGRSEKVAVSKPGLFTIVLEDIEVVRALDNKQFQLTHFIIRDFEITKQNLESGSVEIPVKARGAYRILVTDQYGKPASDTMMLFMNIDGTFELKTNREGEIILLGRPNNYDMKVLPESSSFRWKILPL